MTIIEPTVVSGLQHLAAVRPSAEVVAMLEELAVLRASIEPVIQRAQAMRRELYATVTDVLARTEGLPERAEAGMWDWLVELTGQDAIHTALYGISELADPDVDDHAVALAQEPGSSNGDDR